MAFCPKCKKQFAEAGFCPYDGTRLDTGALTAQGYDSHKPKKPKLRAVSAAEGGAEALSKLRGKDSKAEYDALIGTTLDDRYYIEKKIGEGGMGIVFLAKHTIIEKLVAIKVLKREVARDHSVVKRFVQEAKAASRIGHPNIVDVTDFGTTPDGMTYSVMEFVEGETLKAIIKEAAPMDMDRVLPIVAQLAKAQGAAHQKGIVHRDLKPENVFLINRDGRQDFVKVVDFGIAKVMPLDNQEADFGPRLTRAGTVFGTPEYMAPEQAAGRSDTDRRVDIYALGTILYEMIVGKVPHKGPTMVRTLAMQMLDPIPPPKKTNPDLDISPAFEKVLMKALAKKREERYGTMEEFLAALEDVSAVPLSTPLSGKSAPVVMRAAAGDPTMLEDGKRLPGLPPGADASKVAAEARADKGEAPSAQPRRKRPSSNIDPAFLEGRPAFDHVFDEPPEDRDAYAKWPTVLMVVMLLAGGAYGAYWLATNGSDHDSGKAAKTTPAAGIDAAVRGARTADAAPAAATDAAPVIAKTPPDARRAAVHKWRRRRPDAAPSQRRDITVRVYSEPEGAAIKIDGLFRGRAVPRGLSLSGPAGSRVIAVCEMAGYTRGRVVVKFSRWGARFTCFMKRRKDCVKGLKNPFDDCPD